MIRPPRRSRDRARRGRYAAAFDALDAQADALTARLLKSGEFSPRVAGLAATFMIGGDHWHDPARRDALLLGLAVASWKAPEGERVTSGGDEADEAELWQEVTRVMPACARTLVAPEYRQHIDVFAEPAEEPLDRDECDQLADVNRALAQIWRRPSVDDVDALPRRALVAAIMSALDTLRGRWCARGILPSQQDTHR